MKICLLEPFHSGSHASWAEEFARCSRHQIDLLSLAGRHWKWRMHGGAVSLASRFLRRGFDPDLIFATDMLDLTTFLALTRHKIATTPAAVYFHENQLTYPWSPQDEDPRRQRDAHYGFINYSSALAAEAVLFNSEYHKRSFLEELPVFLGGFPDQRGLETIPAIAEKSEVLSLGMDLQRFDRARPRRPLQPPQRPLILWNHRWEYDKNPEEFFQALFRLDAEGLDFEVAVLGEAYRNRPAIFDDARRRLGPKLLQLGFVEDFDSYAAWLWRADILPVHSMHDFFGASVVQAIYCNVLPLLPKRLAYPEHVPHVLQEDCFYQDFDDLLNRLRDLLHNQGPRQIQQKLREHVTRYDWTRMIERYDDLLEKIALRECVTLP